MRKRMAAPYLVWMLLFTLVPLGMVVYYAFTAKEGGFTLQNLTNIPKYAPVFARSIWLALVATALCLVLAFPVAYRIARSTGNRQRTLLLLVMLPMWMNFLLCTRAWMTLLEDTGLINRFLGLIGLGPVHMINTQGAVILGMVYNYLPFMILPLYSVMVKIDRSVIEAARDLGADGIRVIGRIIIPLSMPGIISGITMVFVPSVSTFIISRWLGGSSNLLIGDLIEQQFIGSAYDPYAGSALALVLMVLMLIIMAIMNLFDSEEIEGAMI